MARVQITFSSILSVLLILSSINLHAEALPLLKDGKVTTKDSCYTKSILKNVTIDGCGHYAYETSICESKCMSFTLDERRDICPPCRPYLAVIKPIHIPCKGLGLIVRKYIKQILICTAKR